MIIQADEASMARMLGVPAAQIPETVLAEYELRLRLFHCDGNSGHLGTIGIIDMLRSMKLGRRPAPPPAVAVDWSRIPANGSVRVMVREEDPTKKPQWRPGAYHGSVGIGRLAILLDGKTALEGISRKNVRIAREEPMEPVSDKDSQKATEPETSLGDTEPWASLSLGDPIMVENDDGDYEEARFQGVNDGEILVLFGDDLTPCPFGPERVKCLENQTVK